MTTPFDGDMVDLDAWFEEARKGVDPPPGWPGVFWINGPGWNAVLAQCEEDGISVNEWIDELWAQSRRNVEAELERIERERLEKELERGDHDATPG